MLSTKTSRMVAVTNPIRWSFEVVDLFFGEVRPRRNQTLAMKGDLVRDLETGEVYILQGREGDMILIEEI
jgi:hypothetical protein